jgi:hypothetical protein
MKQFLDGRAQFTARLIDRIEDRRRRNGNHGTGDDAQGLKLIQATRQGLSTG